MITVNFYDVNATSPMTISAPDNISLGDFLSFVDINRPADLDITLNGTTASMSATLPDGATVRALQKASKSGC